MSARVRDHIRNNMYGLVAIFIALTASAYAVSTAPKNSVTSKSIKNGQVSTKDVKDNSLTGVDVDESTLDGIQGPAGANGAQGPRGATGPQGPTGAAGPAGSIAGAAAGGDLSGTYPDPVIANAKVTIPKLSFDPATQAELDALGTAGTINQAGNPVDWTKLKGVPGAFSDGTDDGGVPSGSAGGDLAGTYPNPTVGANAIGTNEVDGTLTGSDVSDAAGGSLTGSDILESSLFGDNSLNASDIDSSAIQRRVSGSCSVGSSIRVVAADGTVTCETDDDTTAPSGPAGGDLAGSSYPNPNVASNAVALTTDTTGNYVSSVSTDNGLTGSATGSEGSSGTLGLDYSATLFSDTLAANESSFASTGILFEGSTPNQFETLLTPSDPGIDATIFVPNSNGNMAVTGHPASFSTLAVGTGGSTITGIFRGSAVIDFDPILTQTCVDDGPITVTGAANADSVALGPENGAMVPNVSYTAYVASANTVLVRACNPTGSSINPPSATFRATVIAG